MRTDTKLAMVIALLFVAYVIGLTLGMVPASAAPDDGWRYPDAVRALGLEQILAVVGQYDPPRTALEIEAVGPLIAPAVQAAQSAVLDAGVPEGLAGAPAVQEAWEGVEFALWQELRGVGE